MSNKRKCKQCEKYSRGGIVRPIGYFCGDDCQMKFAKDNASKARDKAVANRKKEVNREIKTERNRIKTRGEWFKQAQTAFNRYIRLRDDSEPCISCLRFHDGQFHAGHFLSVGAHPEIRFDESNCHKQCAPCNNHLSGNINNYRPSLILKIGHDAVARLEGPHPPAKWSIEDIKAIEAEYKRKYKELQSD